MSPNPTNLPVLTWPVVTDTGGANGVVYHVFRDGVEIGSTPLTTYTDHDPLSDATYTYRVEAIDAAGNTSPLSTPSVITVDVTPPPQVPSAAGASPTQRPLITWGAVLDDSGIARYDVYRNGQLIGWSSAPTFVDSALYGRRRLRLHGGRGGRRRQPGPAVGAGLDHLRRRPAEAADAAAGDDADAGLARADVAERRRRQPVRLRPLHGVPRRRPDRRHRHHELRRHPRDRQRAARVHGHRRSTRPGTCRSPRRRRRWCTTRCRRRPSVSFTIPQPTSLPTLAWDGVERRPHRRLRRGRLPRLPRRAAPHDDDRAGLRRLLDRGLRLPCVLGHGGRRGRQREPRDPDDRGLRGPHPAAPAGQPDRCDADAEAGAELDRVERRHDRQQRRRPLQRLPQRRAARDRADAGLHRRLGDRERPLRVRRAGGGRRRQRARIRRPRRWSTRTSTGRSSRT